MVLGLYNQQGYVTEACLSQFDAFVRALGGIWGFVACVAVVVLMLAGSLFAMYLRNRQAARRSTKQSAKYDMQWRRRIWLFGRLTLLCVLCVFRNKVDDSTPLMRGPGSATRARAGSRGAVKDDVVGVSETRLKQRDLPAHVHRMYFAGTNAPGESWYVLEQTPEPLVDFVQGARFRRFLRKLNKAARWPSSCCAWERVVLALLRLLVYPLSVSFLQHRRYHKQLFDLLLLSSC